MCHRHRRRVNEGLIDGSFKLDRIESHECRQRSLRVHVYKQRFETALREMVTNIHHNCGLPYPTRLIENRDNFSWHLNVASPDGHAHRFEVTVERPNSKVQLLGHYG